MVMGSVDMAVTRSLKAKEERFQQTMKRLTKELERQKIDRVVTQCIDEEMIPVQTESCSDPEFVCPPTPPIHGKSVRTLALPNLSRECDRWNVSNRTGAAIASATLVDFQIVTEGNKSLVIDKNKFARERIKWRKIRSKEETEDLENSTTSIYFDGKKDNTLTREKVHGKWYPSTITEEHYVCVAEPGGKYLTHVSSTSGHGVNVAKSIYKFINEHKLGNQIKVIGADGTNVNVGWKAGAIRYLEMFLGRALQWQVCLLHGNELPFRALFTYYDGPTTRPTSYSGEIGSQLKEHLSSRDIVDFKRIPNPDFPILPDEVLQDLSWDQKLMYEFC